MYIFPWRRVYMLREGRVCTYTQWYINFFNEVWVCILHEFLYQNQPNSFVLWTKKIDQKNKSSSRHSWFVRTDAHICSSHEQKKIATPRSNNGAAHHYYRIHFLWHPPSINHDGHKTRLSRLLGGRTGHPGTQALVTVNRLTVAGNLTCSSRLINFNRGGPM